MDPKNFIGVIIPISIIILGGIFAFTVKSTVTHKVSTPIVKSIEPDNKIKLENIIGASTIIYSTKGSFIVNNPITVSASISVTDEITLARDAGKTFFLRPSGAVILDDDKAEGLESGAKIPLEWNQGTKRWEGTGKIKYTISGKFGFIISNPDYSDRIRLSDAPESLIDIASSDVSLQIKMNRWIMFLTFISIALAWTAVSEQIYKLFKK